jgi:hypothetical protein
VEAVRRPNVFEPAISTRSVAAGPCWYAPMTSSTWLAAMVISPSLPRLEIVSVVSRASRP